MKLFSITCLFSLLTASAALADLKVATIDMQRAFTDYYKTKDAEALLKDRMGGFQKEMQDMMTDYQKMVDETQKLRDSANDKTLSPAAQDEKRKAFEVKVQDVQGMERKIQEFKVQRTKQFEDQSRRMRTTIVEEITKLVTDLGAKEKYSLIIDKSGQSINGTNILLYSQDVKDVTDDVLKTLNANKPAAGSVAPAPAPPAPPAKP